MKKIKCGECKKQFNFCICLPKIVQPRDEIIKPEILEIRSGKDDILRGTVSISVIPSKYHVMGKQPIYGRKKEND